MYINYKFKQRNKPDNLKLTCNNIDVKFVSEVKLLGVTIDNELTFKTHTQQICKKVNSKTFLLAKSLYLFTDKFKPQLFKTFILPHFDYCSTLFQYLSNKSYSEHLDKCYNKSINRLIKINVYSDIIETQYNKLRKYNILPLKYRHFFRYSTFIYKTLKNNNSNLASRFRINTKQTRSYYILPNMKKDHIKYSFLYIASNLLNSILMMCLMLEIPMI